MVMNPTINIFYFIISHIPTYFPKEFFPSKSAKLFVQLDNFVKYPIAFLTYVMVFSEKRVN